MLKVISRSSIVSVGAWLVVACSGATEPGVDTKSDRQTSTGDTKAAPTKNDGPSPDTGSKPPADNGGSGLAPCCAQGQSGNAVCVPSNLVPADFSSQLAVCSGGLCAPQKFVQSPSYVPKKCASLAGAAGVCLSVCIPEVAQYADILPPDTCDADERCTPCISPLDQKPTGAPGCT